MSRAHFKVESTPRDDTRMMRSLKPSESELIRLIRASLWMSVQRRTKSHPEEASPLWSDGSTALALAVRARAPLVSLQALVETNKHQLEVIHRHHGTILHEALRYHSPHLVIEFLFQAFMEQHEGKSSCCDIIHPLAQQDHFGRTVLHYLVHRTLHGFYGSGDDDSLWSILCNTVEAYPGALLISDCDGHNPLLLALLTFSNRNERDKICLFRMVKLFLATDASVALQTQQCKRGNVTESNSGLSNPLGYALLYGNGTPADTIELILNAQEKTCTKLCSTNPFRTLASVNLEVPLHLAVTMRAPIALLARLNQKGAASMRDRYNLTPVDWVWICHVVDVCARSNASTGISPSRRRVLGSSFLNWHNRATRELLTGSQRLDELWKRASLLLPAAAAACGDSSEKDDELWPVLHAACFVVCPLALTQLALILDRKSLKRRCSRGRLPLHYACTRSLYHATIPVGASSSPRLLQEDSSPIGVLLEKDNRALRVTDNEGQLPLHIAIDHYDQVTLQDLRLLVSKYPDSLERRDGTSKLYPFLQAASVGASVNMIHCLLLEHPTLVASAIL